MLQKFGMQERSPVCTPMVTGCKLNNEDESLVVDKTMYRSMTGSLLYLIASRPDIMQAVGLMARFQANPKESHMIVVKIILRYLKGTIDYGLWYPKYENFDLKVFSNADWEGSLDDRKNTSGNVFFLGNQLLAWSSKKKSSISLSTTEA